MKCSRSTGSYCDRSRTDGAICRSRFIDVAVKGAERRTSSRRSDLVLIGDLSKQEVHFQSIVPLVGEPHDGITDKIIKR